MKDAHIIVFIVVVLLVGALSGCAAGRLVQSEGDGYSNGGKARPPACVIRREGNVEEWGDC